MVKYLSKCQEMWWPILQGSQFFSVKKSLQYTLIFWETLPLLGLWWAPLQVYIHCVTSPNHPKSCLLHDENIIIIIWYENIIQYSCKEVQIRVNNYIFQVIQVKIPDYQFWVELFSCYEMYVNVFYIHYLTMIGHLLNKCTHILNIYFNI